MKRVLRTVRPYTKLCQESLAEGNLLPPHLHVQRGWAEGGIWRLSHWEKTVLYAHPLIPCHASSGNHSISVSAAKGCSGTKQHTPCLWLLRGGGFRSLRLHLGRVREDGEPDCFSQARGPNIGPNGVLALPEVKVCGSWHPAALLPSTPALQKLGHQETQGAGLKMGGGQRTENREKRGAAGREAVHPQESAVSRVYFWQEGNHCKPLD